MSFRGILFDFDGVMVDSIRFHLDAWQHACKKLGDTDLSESIVKKISGKSTRQISDFLCNFYPGLFSPEELIQEKFLYMNEIHAPLYPDVKPILKYLNEQSIPHAIVSNAYRSFIVDHLEYHKVDMEHVFGVEDHPAPKPSPSAYTNAGEILKLQPFHEVIVFEDSLHGLRAGIEAGMYGVGVATHRTENELKAVGAKAVLPELSLEFVKECFS